MHRYFPFDSVVIDGIEIGPEEIVAETMRFVSGGNDTSVTTADGKRHVFRKSVRREAVFEIFGDRQDLLRLKAVPSVLMWNGEIFLTFSRTLLSARFDEERNTTSVRLIEVSFP